MLLDNGFSRNFIYFSAKAVLSIYSSKNPAIRYSIFSLYLVYFIFYIVFFVFSLNFEYEN